MLNRSKRLTHISKVNEMAESETKEVVESPGATAKNLVQEPDLIQGIDVLFDDFRRSFGELMAPFMPLRTFRPWSMGVIPVRAPLLDIVDEDEQYIIRTELPGFAKEDVDIQLNKDFMVLKAEKRADKEEKSENYLHRERSYSSCQRRVNFPEEVDPSKVEGTMKNGVLQLKIPKKEPKPELKMTKVQL
jgi:HSP20 family protein